MKFLLLIFKNVRRNLLRSVLTAMGTIVLVAGVVMVWSIMYFLDQQTAEKTRNFKIIVTERWQLPSRMPFAYADELCAGAPSKPGDYHVPPEDSMTWQFYGGSVDPKHRTWATVLFAIATEPRKILTMFDELDTLPPSRERSELAAAVKRLEDNRQGLIIGRERLAALNKKVGERLKLYSFNYKGIDLDFEIVGVFPDSRWNNVAAMNRDYLNAAVDAYGRQPGNPKHPMADRSLNLVWIRVPDMATFNRVASQITTSPRFTNPAVKCETAASGTATWLEAFRDLIWAIRWLLAPAALVALSLIMANAISISVRERRTELAVLKVLGFRPGQILVLVLGEALLIGLCAGLVSAGLTYAIINWGFGGIKFPIGFFSAFKIPLAALWWGAVIGTVTALVGSALPAWHARGVKVAEVFAKVA